MLKLMILRQMMMLKYNKTISKTQRKSIDNKIKNQMFRTKNKIYKEMIYKDSNILKIIFLERKTIIIWIQTKICTMITMTFQSIYIIYIFSNAQACIILYS